MSEPFSAVIVDDSNDKNLIRLLKTGLGISNVKKCATTIEALALIQGNANISIIFIDYETTLARTFAFVKEAKETGKCKDTRFFLMANESSQTFLAEASQSGISAFILKPYNDKKLLNKAKKILPPITSKKPNRLNLLDSIEARLRYKNKEIIGTIENINDKGCSINTVKFGRMGAEVYDTITIRIDFEKEKLGVNAEIIKIEQDLSKDTKAVTTTFKFKKPNEENAMQFAKFWAHILKERGS